jgi:hypothetical protein
MTLNNLFYPPSSKLKNEIYPYSDTSEFKSDIEKLYNSACRLKLIPDYLASEIESKMDAYFGNETVYAKIKETDDSFEEEFTPDSLNQIYPALPEDKKEEFLYTLRGLILEKLSNKSEIDSNTNDEIDENEIIFD